MSDLRLDYCNNKAAKHAVMRWHYSAGRCPPSSLVQNRRVGIGPIRRCNSLRRRGEQAYRAAIQIERYADVCELVRVALAPASARKHPTSKCVAISLRMLKRQSPGLRLVVSYADAGQGHVGTIYQATNWIFIGAATQSYLKIKGKVVHPRTLYDRYGPGGQSLPWLRKNVDPNAQRVKQAMKLKYIMPLDQEMREKLDAPGSTLLSRNQASKA